MSTVDNVARALAGVYAFDQVYSALSSVEKPEPKDAATRAQLKAQIVQLKIALLDLTAGINNDKELERAFSEFTASFAVNGIGFYFMSFKEATLKSLAPSLRLLCCNYLVNQAGDNALDLWKSIIDKKGLMDHE